MKSLPTAIIFVGLIACDMTMAGVPPRRTDTRDELAAAQKYLQRKYDDFEPAPDGSFHLYGLAYIAAWAPLTPLDPEVTRRFLPEVRFYRTTLHTPNYEYLEVETLVAVRPTARGYDVRSCLSPVYDDVSTKFLAMFESLVVPESQDALDLTRVIAQLLAEITYKGRVGQVSSDGTTYRAELWSDQLHWRDILVKVSNGRSVDTVAVFNPKR
jgi:hypothetical protein